MFGFTSQRAMPGDPGPWSGLPTAPAPWAGSSQIWQPAQQAPWRLSPWSTQGMPPAAPVAPAAQNIPAAPAANPYLSQGTSAGIPGFNPMVPGGGLYPTPAPEPAAAPAAVGGYYLERPSEPGGVFGYTTNPYSAGGGFNTPIAPELVQRTDPRFFGQTGGGVPQHERYRQLGIDPTNPATWAGG